MKIRTEIRKLNAETKKLYTETHWYPLMIATGLVIAIMELAKLIL